MWCVLASLNRRGNDPLLLIALCEPETHSWDMINITLSGNAKFCLGLTELNSKQKAGENR